MRIVISSEDQGLLEYKQVKTVKEVLDILDYEKTDIEGVVFKDTEETIGVTAIGLTQLSKKVNKLLYINREPNPMLLNLFRGLNGAVYTNDDMLRDEGVLDYLLEQHGSTGMEMSTVKTDMDKVTRFIDSILEKSGEEIESLKENSLWNQTLSQALGDMRFSVERLSYADRELVGMLESTVDSMEKVEDEKKTVKKELKEMKKIVEEMERRHSEMGQNTAFFYTTYMVPNTVTRVLNIKVYSPCPYLKSFIESYQHYLKMEKQMSSKLLIAIPKLKQVMKKYEEYPRLDTETVGYVKVVDDVLVTHEPKPRVLDYFFNIRADVHILLDLLYGDDLIKGPKVKKLNGISGVKDAQLYGLAAKDCILPLTGTVSSIRIPYIKGFATENETVQKTLYFQECKGVDGCYARMNEKLEIRT